MTWQNYLKNPQVMTNTDDITHLIIFWLWNKHSTRNTVTLAKLPRSVECESLIRKSTINKYHGTFSRCIPMFFVFLNKKLDRRPNMFSLITYRTYQVKFIGPSVRPINCLRLIIFPTLKSFPGEVQLQVSTVAIIHEIILFLGGSERGFLIALMKINTYFMN